MLRIRIRWIRKFLGLLDPVPDLLVRGTDPENSYCFVTSFLLVIFEIWCKWPSISFLLVFWRSVTKTAGSGSICQRHGSADPDPYQTVMDPQYWLFMTGSVTGCLTVRFRRPGIGCFRTWKLFWFSAGSVHKRLPCQRTLVNGKSEKNCGANASMFYQWARESESGSVVRVRNKKVTSPVRYR